MRVALIVGAASTSVSGFPVLAAIEHDVALFRELVDGFDAVTVLTRSEATVNAVHRGILRWHAELQPGDQFVFAFSGHGARKAAEVTNEPDGFSESLLLADGRLADDSLRRALHGFEPGVFVYALIDACHASGVTFVDTPKPAQVGDRVRRRGISTPGNTVLTLAAANETELARQTERGGLLVDAMRRAWNGGTFSGTWGEFWDLTSRWSTGLLHSPAPQAWLDGPDDDVAIVEQVYA